MATKKKQIIPMLTKDQTEAYLKFNRETQGKLFINASNGLAIPKFDIFLRYGGIDALPEFIEVEEKPGWVNGKMKNYIEYDEYLKDVKYEK